MAIIPSDTYPGQTLLSDPAYPHGKARNVTVSGDGTGTPLEATWLNDLWGFLQALLAEGGVTPSGNPDEVGASDYLTALYNVLVKIGPEDTISPTTLTADVNNYEPPGWDAARMVRVNADAARTIKGLKKSTTPKLLVNISDSNLTLPHLDSGQSAGNQIRTPNGGSYTVPRRTVALIVHDGVSDAWRIVSENQDQRNVLRFAVMAVGGHLAKSAGAGSVFGIATSPTTIATCGSTSLLIQTSSDGGETWDLRESSFTDVLRGICFGTSQFVAVGDGGDIRTSDATGVTWTPRSPDAAYSGDFKSVCFSAGRYVAVGSGGAIQTSDDDGVTWTARAADGAFSGVFYAVSFGNGLYVAIGEGGEIQTSPDGATWTQRAAPGSWSGDLLSVSFGSVPGRFVAVGTHLQKVVTSQSGTSWTLRDSGVNEVMNGVAYSPLLTTFVAVGDNGAIMVSIDGVSWVDITRLSVTDDLRAVSEIQSTVIFGGDNSVMRQTAFLPSLAS